MNVPNQLPESNYVISRSNKVTLLNSSDLNDVPIRQAGSAKYTGGIARKHQDDTEGNYEAPNIRYKT